MSAIKPASRELIALATAARGEDWASDLDGALAAARTAGWSWPRTALYAARLIFTEDASPRDLREAARDPLRRAPLAPPTGEYAAVRPRAGRSVRLDASEAALAQVAESRLQRHAELDEPRRAS
jgi:hypothetical protein